MIQRHTIQTLLALIGLLTLAGCSLSPSLPPPDRSEQAWVNELKHWSMNARISITQASADRADSARLSWKQQQDSYSIQLTGGPFNQTLAMMTGQPGQAEIQIASKNERYTARSPEALMQALLDWNLPIRHAAWWVKGVPDPAITHLPLDQEDSYRFNQAGWEIDILRYREISSDKRLPSRIRMVHNELIVNLAIASWEVNP